MMRPDRPVGIAGYGVYIPRYRIAAHEIARVWGAQGSLPVEAKSVPGPDEDTGTRAIEAARNALARGRIGASRITAAWAGTGSRPSAATPSGALVADPPGPPPSVSA